MRLDEINKRLSAINVEIDEEGADLDELETEINSLKEERKNILDKAEKRKALIDDVTNMQDAEVIKNFKPESEERKMEFNKDNVLGSTEYRNGFLKQLQKQELSVVEQRALTTAVNSVGAVVPEVTQNRILQVIEQHAPLLAEIEVLRVPGGVKIPVEDVVADAAKHAEGATITASGDTITYVDLFGYEITKLLTISKSVQKMSVDAFENWLVNNLGKSLAKKITALIISGSGSGEATGINSIAWTANNSVTVAAASSLTAKNVNDLISLLPGGYDAGAKFLMSKKTLFQDFAPLQDNSKNKLVTLENGQHYIQGYPVMLDDRIALNEAFLGNFYEGYKANMPEDVNVTSDFDLKTNSFDYLGAGMFDGKVALPEAFVKLIKATV
jgi:HK97 family phage major capsid protein